MDKTINDVPLKCLTFQTGQTKWDGGSSKKEWITRDKIKEDEEKEEE